ncbi:hypothetical protein [Nakamurella leprariae]|uniref:Uncharacterized protein n=1 Tax=Nakamurella leprariae TaxID=2803911 RepID=A0A938YCW8_9ACTN|nr:hypothetical protein [Nakamurella leprariae]MBM9467271.1 hypothetical protein [Nakamurella leprariae]
MTVVVSTQPGPSKILRCITLLAITAIYARVALLYAPGAETRLTNPLPAALRDVSGPVPLSVYAGLWLCSAVVVAVLAVRPVTPWTGKRITAALLGAVTMPVAWAWFYLIGWGISGFGSTEWNSAVLYGGLAVVTGCVLIGWPAAAGSRR